MIRPFVLAIGLAGLLSALWGCGGSASTGPNEHTAVLTAPTVNALAPVSAEVTMTNKMKFQPASVTITAGQTVQWKNTSFLVHTVTDNPLLASNKKDAVLPNGAAPFNSGQILPNQVFGHTFTVPGTYKYFCIVHEANGMIGEVIVRPAK